MWPARSRVLTPLTNLLGNNGKCNKFEWGPEQDKAFKEMKALIAKDALLACPDHNKVFKIETDACDYQLGGRLFQMHAPEDENGDPLEGEEEVERDVGFYSRKLNSAQKNYSAIEKELLSIVEILKEYRSMLLGPRIEIYTDHKNLSYTLSQCATQRVLRWRLSIEEFGATFHYKPGESNWIADALSRVPSKNAERSNGKVQPWDPTVDSIDGFASMPLDDYEMAELLTHDPEIAECFLVHPVFDAEGRSPFQFETLRDYQLKSAELQAMPDVFPDRFHKVKFNDTELICLHQNGDDKIVLTNELVPKVVKFCHESMAHAEGEGRLIKTVARHFHHGNIADEVRKQLKDCPECIASKRGGKVCGESAPPDAFTSPWQEVHCDSIGPWKIDLRARTLTFHAMTMIDPCTNLVEIKRTLTTAAKENAAAVENGWLARYPKPLKVVTDQGPEFAQEFTDVCVNNKTKHSTTSSRNPQGNSIVE